MVIISATIFDKFWKDLYDFNFNINLTDRTEKEEKEYYRFLEYFFRGFPGLVRQLMIIADSQLKIITGRLVSVKLDWLS